MRSVEAPVFFTYADLQRRYACSRVWVQRQIQKHNFPTPVKPGDGAGVRHRWPVPLVLEWENKWMTAPLNINEGVS